MSAGEVHLNDKDQHFEHTIRDEAEAIVDLTSAGTMQILFRKPSGEVLTKVAVKVNAPGTDGKIEYISIAGDMNETGGWKRQGRVTVGGGPFSSDIVDFTVYPNVD